MSRAAPAARSFARPAGFADRLRRARDRFFTWRNRKIASPRFQAWAARFWATRAVARRDAERLFDLTAGFVYSQTLSACLDLGVLETLQGGPRKTSEIAAQIGIEPERALILMQAAAALGLTARAGGDRYRLGRLGAAALGAPGLAPMIRHHKMFYADLADPAALLQGGQDTELARFWPYVRGDRAVSTDEAARYSELMAASQAMVAEETLASVSLRGYRRLLDVGGGAGAFLTAAAQRWPDLELALFDLPEVASQARDAFAEAGLSARATAHGGRFPMEPLPTGADAISLVRVLYDHDDDRAAALLDRAFEALPPGGLLIVSEPMSGGERPSRSGDVYFGFYTMAMTSGRPRSPRAHAALLTRAGFNQIAPRRTGRPFITSVITARRPG